MTLSIAHLIYYFIQPHTVQPLLPAYCTVYFYVQDFVAAKANVIKAKLNTF